MRLVDYDMIMLARWRYYFPNTYLVTTDGEADKEVRNQIANENPEVNQAEESIYPYLALKRIGVPLAQPMGNNMSAVQRGYRLHKEEQVLPMTQFLCTYQLDAYSTDREIFDELVVEIQENILREGYLNVDTGDPKLGTQSYTMDLEEVEDNSDVESFSTKAPVYRCTFVYSIMYVVPRRWRHLRVEEFILTLRIKEENEDVTTDIESTERAPLPHGGRIEEDQEPNDRGQGPNRENQLNGRGS